MNRRSPLLAVLLVALLGLTLLPSPFAIAQDGAVTDLNGGDPTADSIALSQYAYPDGATDVALARDDESADALSSGFAQGVIDGPLLLTSTDALEADVEAEIDRLGATTVHIFGGTAAVSQAVETALANKNLTIVRYQGPSRLETALHTYGTLGSSATTAVLARAFGAEGNPTAQFADSIGGGALASALGYPVLLTQTDQLSGATAAAIESSPLEQIIILGGTAAISAQAENDLRGLGLSITRLSGAERTTTAQAIADYLATNTPTAVSRVILVDAFQEFGWAAGFAAAGAAASGDTVVLLVNGDDIPAATQAWLDANPTAEVVCGPNVSDAACAAAGRPGETAPGFFVHTGTYDVTSGGNVSAEIVDYWDGGDMLVFTDSPGESLGLVDISDPAAPTSAGTVDLGGEPTSVATIGDLALVGINTSADFLNPSGELRVYDLSAPGAGQATPLATIDMGGQPDSVAVSPDGTYAAIAIENERDEDTGEGLIPQLPAGKLVVVDTSDADPANWTASDVDMTGFDGATAPTDPEPEYVDINDDNIAVVTLQENNHLALVDLATGEVIDDYTQGSVTLDNVDATEEAIGPQESGDLQLTETITRRREADAVTWIGTDYYATANEGDYTDAEGVEGGSRGFTLFNTDGTVAFDIGNGFEHQLIAAGHYNEGRSANKGTEAEGAETGTFGGTTHLFIGGERANAVAVYTVDDMGGVAPLQTLPTGIAPEGLKAIESKDLFVVAAEVNLAAEEDDPGLPPSLITIYSYGADAPAYPTLVSADEPAIPTPWTAMSGLAGGLEDDLLHGVSDSILGVGYVYDIALADGLGLITGRTPITGASFNLDLEGIAVDPDGGYWLASEGRYTTDEMDVVTEARPNAIVRTDASGAVTAEYELPAALVANATSSGFEGVALGLDADGAVEYVYAIVQREWADDAANHVKIARLDPSDGSWTFAAHEKVAPESPNGGWVGMSEITALPDGTFALVERDNQLGANAAVKRIMTVDLAAATFVEYGQALEVVPATLAADVLDVLEANSILTPDKLEGLGVTAGGEVWLSTDNDGLDDAIGQTVFTSLGTVDTAFSS